ncbi:hypothetical protein QEN19_001698 [Hanseniaspora menglaensis]
MDSSIIMRLREAVSFENVWFLGHCLTLAGSIMYGVSFFMSTFLYKTIFAGVLISFGIQLYQKYISVLIAKKKETKKKSLKKLFLDVNFQYFFIALVWFLTSSSMKVLAIPPFVIFSSFHILSYSRKVNENTNNQISSIIPKPVLIVLLNLEVILRNHRDKLVELSSVCEVSLFVHLLIRTLLFSKTSLIQLVCYLIFIKIRLLEDSSAPSSGSDKNNNCQLLIKNFKILDEKITFVLQKQLPQNNTVRKVAEIYEKQMKNIIVKKFVETKIPILQSSEETKKTK